MRFFFTIVFVFVVIFASSQNLVIVVIDGARYSETFGDETFSNIPYMSDLASQGTYLDEIYNEHDTWTSAAIPALWTGGWEGSYSTTYNGSSTQATYMPSIFEYFRKQKNADSEQSFYTLKYVSSLWLQSFHQEYGEEYWPETISSGANDNDVLTTTLGVIENYHPQLLWVYLADVDSQGYTGIWDNYIATIQNADEIVNTLWTTLQNDPVYQNNTTMLVTNDHGRHDYDFSGHGCSCEGCQHIMFLAIGPDIKQNYVSTTHHEIADVAVTAAHILDVNPEYSTGEMISEMFISSDIEKQIENAEINIYNHQIDLTLSKEETISIEIYDILGRKIEILAKDKKVSKDSSFTLSNNYTTGIYILKLQYNENTIVKKFFVN